MKPNFTILFLCAIPLSACTTIAEPISIGQLSVSNHSEEEKIIKTCGWASNEFENVRITEHRDENWRKTAKGFGVQWLPDEPKTNGAEWRCITGKVIPKCGWDTYNNPEETCVNTGHSHDWVIVQTNRNKK